MKPLLQPAVTEWKPLKHRVNSPRRRTMCGELVAVLTMNPAGLPGMKTALSPETSDRTRNGLVRCCFSRCANGVSEAILDRL